MPPKPRSLAGAGSTVIANRKATHDFDILERVEAGLVLAGAEVKSIRDGQVQLRDAYARVEAGECWLHGVHISPWKYAVGFGAVDPDRTRKLLMHSREIAQLGARVAQDGLTLVPLALYFKEGRVKCEIGLARGRKTHDKRHAIAKRDSERDEARDRRATRDG